MLELEHRFRVVDVHGHLDHDEVSVSTHGRNVGPDRLERECLQAGVVQTAVSPTRRPDDIGYLRANNAVARLSVDRPFLAFARLNGPLAAADNPISKLRNLYAPRKNHHTRPGDVEQYAYDDRFHGFTLAPAADGMPDAETVGRLEEVGLPLVVHAGQAFPPQAVAETLLDRDIPVILAGLGGYPLDRDLLSDAIDLLDRYDRLYLDTAQVRVRSVLERALLEHPDRVLFGSGAPEVHPNVGVMEILTLDVSENAMRRAFSANASRVVPELAPGES